MYAHPDHDHDNTFIQRISPACLPHPVSLSRTLVLGMLASTVDVRCGRQGATVGSALAAGLEGEDARVAL